MTTEMVVGAHQDSEAMELTRVKVKLNYHSHFAIGVFD